MRRMNAKKSELEQRLEAEAQAEAADGIEPDSDDRDDEVTIEVVEDAESSADAQAIDQEFETLRVESELLRDQLLRARAEFDNYRKRMARDAERTRKRAAEELIRDLLPVADHLELALQHSGVEGEGLTDGVMLVEKQLQDVLAKHGLERITAESAPFDPHVHEAVAQQEALDVPDHTVIHVFQPGYCLGENVLRPAKVLVSTGGPPRTNEGNDA